MNKSLLILAIALLATGVDAHDPNASEKRLRQLLSSDSCSYCDEQRAADAAQAKRQKQINDSLQRIEQRQEEEWMRDFHDRANTR